MVPEASVFCSSAFSASAGFRRGRDVPLENLFFACQYDGI